ncbi:ABC transporter permease [Azospirillum canadense]|uniref:ABC transporter permease n=1 Tax=Azospirillum canadense TaxID=403962 RepID=UPI002226A4A4|nr:iron ABC transporter permease [Azospirillum canadense]MCW2240509.1 iron(III) transport system permease protein [Azospirillum canadense]
MISLSASSKLPVSQPKAGRFNAALIVIAVIVFGFVGYPIVAGLAIFDFGALGRLFSAQNIDPLINSIVLAALAVIPATAIGVPLAWMVARTDLPGRNLVGLLVSVSFVVPNLLTSIAYIFLFGKNAGVVNAWLFPILGGPLYDIYSFSGVVFLSAVHAYPLIFFTTLSGLARMNPELEEAGRICGLSPLAIFFRITLGAILPSVMAGIAFAIAETLTMLAGPLLLGLPVGIRFMTTELYSTIVMNPNLSAAISLSLPLVTLTVFMLWVQARILGGTGSSRFAILAGKGARSETIALGPLRTPALVLAWIPIVLSLVLPVATLLLGALMKQWWRGVEWDNMTLSNFAYLIDDPSTYDAIRNSLILAVGIGGVMALLGGVLAIVLAGEQTSLKHAVRQLTELPLGIPHVVAGVLIILAWYGHPFHLGGSLLILALGYVLVTLPYALKTCEAARGQIDSALGEAAQMVGCSPVQSWRYVVLPLMKNGLLTTFIIVFLFVIKEFSLTALVYSSDTTTLPVRVFTFLEGGSYEKTAAASIVLLVLTLGGLLVAGKLFRINVANIKV